MPGRTLLLGGNGFIGGALARRLSSQGRPVDLLSRQACTHPMAHVRWHRGSVGDTDLLDALLDGADAVVYLASASTPGSNVGEPTREAQDNLLPLLGCIEAMMRHPPLPLVYLSSGGAIYGNPSAQPVNERHALAPLSYHAAGKAAAEHFLGVFSHQGHTVTVLRPANVYGPGQTMKAGFGVIRTLLDHLRYGTPMTIWGDGETVRDYLYIEDMVDACMAVLDAPTTGVFNVGSGRGISLKELCRAAEEVTGKLLAVQYRPARNVDVRAVTLDTTSFCTHYGWRAHTGIEAGLRATWTWLNSKN